MKKTDKVSYKLLKDELDDVMSRLQAEDLDIDEAVSLYKKGVELIKQLDMYLQEAENTFHELKAKFDIDNK